MDPLKRQNELDLRLNTHKCLKTAVDKSETTTNLQRIYEPLYKTKMKSSILFAPARHHVSNRKKSKGQTIISSVFNRWNHGTLNYLWYEGYQFHETQKLTEKVSHVYLNFTEITNINDGITSYTLYLNKHNHARRYRNYINLLASTLRVQFEPYLNAAKMKKPHSHPLETMQDITNDL